MSDSPVAYAATTPAELYERQSALEAEMVSRGVDKFHKQINDAKVVGQESTTPYGSYLTRRAIAPVAKGIREFLEAANDGRPGRKHVAAVYLSQVEPEVAAFITLRACLNFVSSKFTLQNAAVSVAGQIETEVRLAHFEKTNPDVYRMATKVVEKSQHERYRRVVYSYIAGNEGLELPSWPKRDKLLLGQKLIEIVVETTGYIEIAKEYKSSLTSKGSEGYIYNVVGSPRCLEWIARLHEYTELAMPEYMPMLVPPRPWTNPFDGGYYTLLKPLVLVKHASKGYLTELDASKESMPEVYRAINAMQETGYRINQQVFEVMQQCWNSGGNVAGVPHKENLGVPPCPACGNPLSEYTSGSRNLKKHPCFENDKEILITWKRLAAETHVRNVTTLSKRVQFARTLQLAERFKDDTIYFPMQLDFRCRCYAVSGFLNPQGADPAKGLLLFSEGKPLENDAAVQWLAIHGANTFGNDKVSLTDRHAWVLEHEQEILAIAANPYDARMWQDADKPWQFLAFCFEWAAYKQATSQGQTHISTLPVAMDGTCNGLQIFSLLLRDPVGGAATNLVPSDVPQDIYQIVADKVIRKLEEKCASGRFVYTKSRPDESWYDERDIARRLLAFGISRKTTKRQVMVLPYGGTFRACCEYTLEHLNDRLANGEGSEDTITAQNAFRTSCFLGTLIWDAIGETVIAAKAAMAYLQELAVLSASEGLPLVWTTPVGFIVNQAYRTIREYRVETKLGASIVRLTLREEGEEMRIDKRRQRNGISPNFVHSLDAAALCRSVALALDCGVTSFMMVHDSYGVLAADAAVMARCLRTAFVGMFGEQDVLQDFTNSISGILSEENQKKLPKPPKKGALDVSRVLESDYFFA